jgi:hypothetical protein
MEDREYRSKGSEEPPTHEAPPEDRELEIFLLTARELEDLSRTKCYSQHKH